MLIVKCESWKVKGGGDEKPAFATAFASYGAAAFARAKTGGRADD